MLKIILLGALSLLLTGCKVTHKTLETTKSKYDSAFSTVKNDTTSFHQVIIADTGIIFNLPAIRPAIRQGESITTYAADNAISIKVFGEKKAITDNKAVIHEQAQGAVTKTTENTSKKVDKDSTVKANVSTAWVWILGGLACLLAIVLIFLRRWKVI